MEGIDNKRAFKCVELGVGWLRLDGLDTTHLKKNSWNCEIHSEAIKGTQLRWLSKSLILKNFAGNSTSRNGPPTRQGSTAAARDACLAMLARF